jgi:hypothetical protein
MRGNESIEDRVVKNAQTRLVVCEIMASRLVVIVEHQATAACNDALGRLRYCQTVDLVEWAIERLYGRESSNVPHFEHAADVSGDDLIRSRKPLNTG